MGNAERQVVLVTGATAGIGRHAALHLARQGHRVLASGRRPEALAALVDEARAEGLDLEAVGLDVTSAESIAAAAAEVERRTGGRGLDVLVNNAGYGHAGPVESATLEQMRAQFETNVFGLVQVTRAFLPAMRRRGAGKVINISSIGGRVTFPLLGVYNASKYAVEALSDAMRVELAPFGIRVVLIEPGMIRSEFSARAQGSLSPVAGDAVYGALVTDAVGRFREMEQRMEVGPEATSAAIAAAVAARRPRARYVTPASARVMLALVALLPTRWVDAFYAWSFGLNRRALPASHGDASQPAALEVAP